MHTQQRSHWLQHAWTSAWLRSVALAFVATSSLGACERETRPVPGYGEPVPMSGGSGGMGGSGGVGGSGARDASLDGGSGGMNVDASTDSGNGGDASDSGDASEVDASRCAAGCTGNTSQCDPATDLCVQCLESSDCGDDERCSGARECVECEQDAHCTELDAAYCDLSSHTCEPCFADAACERFEDTPECDEISGACVACTADTEDEHCGSVSCDREQGICSSVEQGSLQACSACQADSECASGLSCVEHLFQDEQDQSLGSFCFYRKGSVGCADTNPQARPYSQELDTRSVDRVESTYCLPITSCEAIADATNWDGVGGGAKSCGTDSTACGVDDVDDGVCIPSGSAMGKCSYGCLENHDCPSLGFPTCSGSVGMKTCQP